MSTATSPEQFLSRFGLKAFRPGQREVIDSVLSGEDCLCVMPTGGGKSLCYQLPAIAGAGLTLVISPLIALMKDQVDQLEALGLRATCINSMLAADEVDRRLEGIAAGEYDLVYVAPERFRSSRFLSALGRAKVGRLAIDEAHCISEWGHDFRPDYARLGDVRRRIGSPATIALTATATQTVRDDIVAQLQLSTPRVYITGFARENLSYEVAAPGSLAQKQAHLIDFLRQTPGSGIIYASTRKRCEEVAELVTTETNRSTTVYHAGLDVETRQRAQDDFMTSRSEIVVATTAFGMGIDKPDVRFVVHYNLPGTLEAYYQEAGRAGRDGLPSRCLLLYNAGDRYIQEFFIDTSYPPADVVAQVYNYLRSLDDDPIEQTQDEIKSVLGLQLGTEAVGSCEQVLERAGALRRLDSRQNMAVVRIETQLPTLVDVLPRTAKVRRRVMQALEQLVGPRRGEDVYFNPQSLAERVEMTPTALSRTLRELRDVGGFSYVPPFRGRAIQLLQRERALKDLDIDLPALEARRQTEHDKLRRVLEFARSRQCRQLIVLEYFGDPEAATCGRCDNCRGSEKAGPTAKAESSPAAVELLRMVLSGVARCSERFGKQVIAQMLCGSASSKMKKLRLESLSTFGLLSELKQTDVLELLDWLINVDYVEQVEHERFRPVLGVTESGKGVLRDAGSCDLDIPAKFAAMSTRVSKIARDPNIPAGPSEQDSSTFEESELFSHLQKWRRDQAETQSVPAYRVITNATITELAQRRPTTLDQLAEISGIGPAKLDQYGDALLELLHPDGGAAVEPEEEEEEDIQPEVAPSPVTPDLAQPPAAGKSIRDFEEAQALASVSFEDESFDEPFEPVETQSTARSEPSEAAGPHYWTWRILQAGFQVEECAAIRQCEVSQMLEHATVALKAGWKLDPGFFLSADELARLSELSQSPALDDVARLQTQMPEIDPKRLELAIRCVHNAR